MMNLIRINLLPYREELSQKKKRQFKIMMASAALVGVGLAILTFGAINQAISLQEDRNTFLENENKKMDEVIKEIATLKAEKEDFLAKKQKVEELQSKRFEGARIVDTLNQLLPEGTFITSVSSKDEILYEISGKASSDNRIAVFMRVLPSTGVFNQPELLSIEKTDNGQKFVIKTSLNPTMASLSDETGSSVSSNVSVNANSASDVSSEENAASEGK